MLALTLSGCSWPYRPLEIPPGPYEHSYVSTTAKRELPYLVQYPDGEPKGILIYMHGAGGGMEQGMQDGTYKNNFKNLKDLLKKESFIYVTPAMIDFESGGAQDLIDLSNELRVTYPELPIYLAGASAGGRTVAYALEKEAELFKGAILLCPALASGQTRRGLTVNVTPLYVMQGIQDSVVPVTTVDAFVARVKEQGHQVEYRRVNGDHDTPVQDVDWEEALQTLMGEN